MEPITDHMRNVSLSHRSGEAAAIAASASAAGPDDAASASTAGGGGGDGSALVSGGTGKAGTDSTAATSGKDNVRERGRREGEKKERDISATRVVSCLVLCVRAASSRSG